MARRGRLGKLPGHEGEIHCVWDSKREVLHETKHVKLDKTIFPVMFSSAHVTENDQESEHEF